MSSTSSLGALLYRDSAVLTAAAEASSAQKRVGTPWAWAASAYGHRGKKESHGDPKKVWFEKPDGKIFDMRPVAANCFVPDETQMERFPIYGFLPCLTGCSWRGKPGFWMKDFEQNVFAISLRTFLKNCWPEKITLPEPYLWPRSIKG